MAASGQWEPCACLLQKQRTSRYRRAEIPPVYDRESWRERLSTLKSTPIGLLAPAQAFKLGKLVSGGLVVSGPFRNEVAALVLRAACDGKLEALWTDVPKLIEHWMTKRDQKQDLDPHRVHVLAVTCGREPRHSYNRHVMEKLVRDRRDYGCFTVVICEGDPARLGTLYQSRAMEAITDTYTRVRT